MTGVTNSRIHDAPVLLTGASGFVGGHLFPVLAQAGQPVRALSRNPARARARFPGRDFIGGDIADEDQVARALDGCRAAYYLVHGMAEGDAGFRRREVESAHRFARAAERVGIERIVYL